MGVSLSMTRRVGAAGAFVVDLLTGIGSPTQPSPPPMESVELGSKGTEPLGFSVAFLTTFMTGRVLCCAETTGCSCICSGACAIGACAPWGTCVVFVESFAVAVFVLMLGGAFLGCSTTGAASGSGVSISSNDDK